MFYPTTTQQYYISHPRILMSSKVSDISNRPLHEADNLKSCPNLNSIDILIPCLGSPAYEDALRQFKYVARQYAYFYGKFQTTMLRDYFTFEDYRYVYF